MIIQFPAPDRVPDPAPVRRRPKRYGVTRLLTPPPLELPRRVPAATERVLTGFLFVLFAALGVVLGLLAQLAWDAARGTF